MPDTEAAADHPFFFKPSTQPYLDIGRQPRDPPRVPLGPVRAGRGAVLLAAHLRPPVENSVHVLLPAVCVQYIQSVNVNVKMR